MRIFDPKMSMERDAAGRFSIKSYVPNGGSYDIEDFSNIRKKSNEKFLSAVTNIIENILGLNKSDQPLRTLETIDLYEAPNGHIVEVVQDQFYGLMVESEDKEIIEKIYKELIKE
ncbi:MAG: hypothetical protein HUU57_04940 [Bdellovibrio sp.]|nr:hypothetical protein [Bdellovibrio sp.]